jgi:hypothetical protein
MMRQNWWYGLVVSGLVLWLTGCAIDNPNSDNGDIQANAFVPAAVAQESASLAQNGPTIIRLQPESQQLAGGVLGNVEIRVENIANLYGVDIGLQFNPNIIQVQDWDPGQDGVQIQPGNFLSPDLIAENLADNITGNITFIMTQTAPSPPVNGVGSVAVITFRAVAPGTTNLNFTSVKLSDPDGNQIPANVQSGQIIVNTPGQPTLTPTSTPVGVTATPPGDTPTPTPTLEVATFTPIPIPTSTPIPPTTTPVPPNMVIPPGATVGFCYRVEACETLACVGQKFGVDPYYLNLVNDLSPSGYVFMHQALFIPTVYGQGPNVYIVETGDTLASIADACHLPLDFLAWVNCLPENANLEPGHVLEIPIPPFPPPSRYAYPGSIAPSVPSDKPLPPPSVGCRGGCSSGACGSNW